MKNVQKTADISNPSAAKTKGSMPRPSPKMPDKMNEIPLTVESSDSAATELYSKNSDRLPFLIAATDEVVIDLSTSCTKDVAVAKLIGLVRGPIRRVYQNDLVKKLSQGQHPHLDPLNAPVIDQLMDLRNASRWRLTEAISIDRSDAEILKFKEHVAACDELIHLAAHYFRDIDDELAKGANSQLRVDQSTTVTPANPYISLSSLELWAMEKYNISVMRAGVDPIAIAYPGRTNDASEHHTARTVSTVQKEQYASGKAEVSLLVTFAFLMDAFLAQVKLHGDEKQIDNFFKGKEKITPNVSAITRHLEELMAQANGKMLLNDQQIKSINNRITAAVKAQTDAFPKRKIPF